MNVMCTLALQFRGWARRGERFVANVEVFEYITERHLLICT